MMANRKYFPEHIAWITDNIKGRSYRELTDMFNTQFGMTLKVPAMVSLSFRHGLGNERDTRFNKGYEPTQFKKGHIPYNKGKKKWYKGGEETQFKSGHKPWNYKPVGTERINGDGYIEIKTAEPKTWRPKHILIWTAANGPVPKGHAIIFGDGDRQNLELDNLILVSRKQLAVLNKNRLIRNSVDLTKSGIVIADIYLKIGERKKRRRRTD